MRTGDIPYVSVPLRNWKSFLPCWLLLPAMPLVLLKGANDDRLLLYFWLFVAPLLAAALWPVARLWSRGIISNMDCLIWVVMVPMCLAGAIGYAYLFLKASLL